MNNFHKNLNFMKIQMSKNYHLLSNNYIKTGIYKFWIEDIIYERKLYRFSPLFNNNNNNNNNNNEWFKIITAFMVILSIKDDSYLNKLKKK